MPKPIGIDIVARNGLPTFAVSKASQAEDKIYDAVEHAVCEGMTVTRFIAIAREAWQYENDQKTKADDDEFKRSIK